MTITMEYGARPGKTYQTRVYQREAEEACYVGWRKYLRIVVSLPTGMGKTVIMANIIKREFAAGNRTIVFVNRDELVGQTVSTIREIAPEIIVGVIQGPRNQVGADVIVASIQTLGRNVLRRQHVGNVGLIVVDECHHGAAETYVESIRDLGGFISTRVLGFTATAARNDGLGMGDVWQRVVYSKTIEYAFANGFLVRPEIRNLSSMERRDAMWYANSWAREAGNRQGMIIVSTVADGIELRDAFRKYGIPAEMIEGKTKKADRDRIYAATIARSNQVLISVSCLTEGFDMPQLEVIGIKRKIGSQTVYVQAVGRALRLYPGKTSALVLDWSGASAQFTLTVSADLSKSAPGKREAAARPSPIVRYKVTHSPGPFGTWKTHVWRVQNGVRTELGSTIRIGSKATQLQKAKLRVRQDQAELSGVNTLTWE
jgi:superfamily II DNA or RNA helicase